MFPKLYAGLYDVGTDLFIYGIFIIMLIFIVCFCFFVKTLAGQQYFRVQYSFHQKNVLYVCTVYIDVACLLSHRNDSTRSIMCFPNKFPGGYLSWGFNVGN